MYKNSLRSLLLEVVIFNYANKRSCLKKGLKENQVVMSVNLYVFLNSLLTKRVCIFTNIFNYSVTYV